MKSKWDKATERVHKASMGYLTKVSIKRMVDCILNTKDIPTHYIDPIGVCEIKIDAKPRTKSRRLLNT